MCVFWLEGEWKVSILNVCHVVTICFHFSYTFVCFLWGFLIFKFTLGRKALTQRCSPGRVPGWLIPVVYLLKYLQFHRTLRSDKVILFPWWSKIKQHCTEPYTVKTTTPCVPEKWSHYTFPSVNVWDCHLFTNYKGTHSIFPLLQN